MNNKPKDGLKILDGQMIALILSLITSFVALMITCNEKLLLLKKRPLFSPKRQKDVAIINRVIILIITLIFLYNSYKSYLLCKQKKDDTRNDQTLIFAFFLALISAILLLYVVCISPPTSIEEAESQMF